ncbi:superoxide dismutase [Panacibacter sp. DH6]|uniref:Superoxide dismutase n=1 Tax=Panacibacter microcysteis TaxID=2793269 RepID=A0A931E9B6_9BACT|nr:superoxide dismutase [Panacibacter microcysteis]MBG9377736.1 superoxide dismutase [Panacibacter microcysteis]
MKKPTASTRRDFLSTSGKAGIAAGLSLTILPSLVKANSPSNLSDINVPETPYTQQPLPYAYNALEPVIDAMTMEIHYSKHAATYAKNLAEAAAAEKVDTGSVKLEQLLGSVSKYSAKMRNNAGGHYNHELFWKCMRAPQEGAKPAGKLVSAIEKDFSSFDAFKTQFTDAGKNRFGSGWAWLIATPGKKLVVASTPNQDNPLMDVAEVKGIPLLGLDVWEHAYYLKYQNRRPDYINAWWNVVNWDYIQSRFDAL